MDEHSELHNIYLITNWIEEGKYIFFRRQKGQFREINRQTSFKLIKSGKHCLRASTSHFGLLKVLRGQVDTSQVKTDVVEDSLATSLTGLDILRGGATVWAIMTRDGKEIPSTPSSRTDQGNEHIIYAGDDFTIDFTATDETGKLKESKVVSKASPDGATLTSNFFQGDTGAEYGTGTLAYLTGGGI